MAEAISFVEIIVEISRDWNRKTLQNFTARNEQVPLVVMGDTGGITILTRPEIGTTAHQATLKALLINGDLGTVDEAVAVEIVPTDVDQDDTVTDEQPLAVALNVDPP